MTQTPQEGPPQRSSNQLTTETAEQQAAQRWIDMERETERESTERLLRDLKELRRPK